MSKEITIKEIQELRNKTGLGIGECKKALQASNGNIEKAIEELRKKGAAIAAKRGGNVTKQGVIYSYIHSGNKVGVLIEVNCETDFVANTDVIRSLAQDIAMHVAATKPLYISSKEVPAEVIAKEEEIFRNQLQDQKKPEAVITSIIGGKIKKYFAENCLLEQNFIKSDKETVAEYLNKAIAKVGENIVVRRFTLYELGA
jgi:elongation factor Ts